MGRHAFFFNSKLSYKYNTRHDIIVIFRNLRCIILQYLPRLNTSHTCTEKLYVLRKCIYSWMIVNNNYRHSERGRITKDDVRVPFYFNDHRWNSEQTKNVFNCRVQLSHRIKYKSTDWKDIHTRNGNPGQKKQLRVNYISRKRSFDDCKPRNTGWIYCLRM